MEINIISTKLLVYSIIVAVVFLLFKTLLEQSNNSLLVTVCNEQDSLEIYLRYHNNDFLINPSSVKNATYCLSKSMPFYDRTIEYMINPSGKFSKGIIKRYTVINTIMENTIKIGEFNLEMSSKKLIVVKNKQNIIIYKRPLQSLLDLYSSGPSKVHSVIRPVSSETSERLLIKNGLDQQRVLNGDFIVRKY